MGSLTLTISYAKNTGLVFNSTELKNLYFQGIPIIDINGNPFPEETIDFYIGAAQSEIENELSIRFIKQAYKETKDFVVDDYVSWNYVPTLLPVVTPLAVQGFLNSTLQINYPSEWLSAKTQSDDGVGWRSIQFVPLSGPSSTLFGTGVLVGIVPYLSNLYGRSIPNYWSLTYTSGFNKIPKDLLNVIGKMASINLFESLGDLVTGVPGVASKSIGIDGLSQSINTLRGFSMRIESYRRDIEIIMPKIKGRYLGYIFGAL